MYRLFFLSVLFLGWMSCGNPDSSSNEAEDSGTEESMGKEIKGEEVSYKADSIEMKGYLAYDENATEKLPGILVVHEWWGHNEYTRKRAEMLAELGYVALAVDMYGDGKTAQHPEDAGKFSGAVFADIDGAKARFEQAYALLKNNPKVDSEKIAAIGYCFGGSVVLTMANMGMDLDAVAAFHSGVQLPVQAEEGKLKAKILVCNGADDPFIPAESVAAFEQSMKDAKADYKYISYPGAVHAFTSPTADEMGKKFDLPLAYNKEADEKSWAELQSLLKSVF